MKVPGNISDVDCLVSSVVLTAMTIASASTWFLLRCLLSLLLCCRICHHHRFCSSFCCCHFLFCHLLGFGGVMAVPLVLQSAASSHSLKLYKCLSALYAVELSPKHICFLLQFAWHAWTYASVESQWHLQQLLVAAGTQSQFHSTSSTCSKKETRLKLNLTKQQCNSLLELSTTMEDCNRISNV